MPVPLITRTASEEETSRLAEALGATLRPGDAVLLFGDLGAGKTAFVRGLASGLGIDAAGVNSPTFTIIQTYQGRVPLCHVDLYRLGPGEVDDLGLDELAAEAVLAVEWAERLPRAPRGALEVRINDLGGDQREIVIGKMERGKSI